MQDKKPNLNFEYKLVQSAYWMSFCVCVSYAAVALQARGYGNFELGAVMACGNIGGFLLSPFLASLVDSSKRITITGCLYALFFSQTALLVLLMLTPGKSFLISALYCLYMTVTICVNPMNTSLCLELEALGQNLHYGSARGIGSFAYSLLAMPLGALIRARSAGVLPYVGLVFSAVQLAILFVLSAQCRHLQPVCTQERPDMQKNGKSLIEFIRCNKRFCVFLLGVAVLFFAHNLANNYLINIVRNAGGDEASLGRISSFSAIIEIPFMLLYDRISSRVRCVPIIRFAAAMFTVKILCIALAPSVPWLFAAHIMQGFSFALMTPALVQYVCLTIAPEDSAKGQSLSYGMSSLGSIFSGFCGGLMFDSFPVRISMIIGTCVCAVGSAVCVVTAGGENKTTPNNTEV